MSSAFGINSDPDEREGWGRPVGRSERPSIASTNTKQLNSERASADTLERLWPSGNMPAAAPTEVGP